MLYVVENLIYILVNLYFIKMFYSACYSASSDSTNGGSGVQIVYMLVFLPLTLIFARRTSVFFDYAFNLSFFHTFLLFFLILLPAWLLVISLFFDSQRLFNLCSVLSFIVAPIIYVLISAVIIYLNLSSQGIPIASSNGIDLYEGGVSLSYHYATRE
ncbi:MAG: hypothetical protein V5789_09585 [Colwellia sp.]